jgi:diguanylate cyclase (GGDEF)-like protein
MKRLRPSTIGRKIAVLVIVSVLASIMTVASLLVAYEVNQSIAAKKDELLITSNVYASAVATSLAAGDRLQALSVLSSMTRVPDLLFAAVIDSNGKALASLGSTTFLKSDLITDGDGSAAILYKGVLPVSVDVVRGGSTVGKLVLIANVSVVRRQVLVTLLFTAIAAAIAIAIGIAIAIPIQNRVTAPIVSLTRAMRHVRDSKDYGTKVEHGANDETGVMVEAFNTMLSEIESRDTELEKLAYCDALTGLYNRQYFQFKVSESLARLRQEGRSAALFLLDLDDFKQINDAFGHQMGDNLLIEVAHLLSRGLRDEVKLVRLGGDEFAIIAEDIGSEDEALRLLATFVSELDQPIKLADLETHVSTSVGVALMPRDGSTSDEILRCAELALYSGKRSAQGSVSFFRPSMDTAAREHADLEQGLRRALSNGEFLTFYQPQVDLRSGQIYGFECLLRWNSPQQGMVSPGVFIPVAESSGLIEAIGTWILRDGCRTAQAWLQSGLPPREISVNVSPAQLMQAGFVQTVAEILAETGFPAPLLCLELTESIFIGKSLAKVSQILQDLKKLGVSLALDDFGTGYSSLSYLEKLPFDKIKIDRSFVSGIESDGTKRQFLKGIISLTHTLDRQVVVEGAETEGELAILKTLKADSAQGYVFSPAVREADLAAACARITLALMRHAPASVKKSGKAA